MTTQISHHLPKPEGQTSLQEGGRRVTGRQLAVGGVAVAVAAVSAVEVADGYQSRNEAARDHVAAEADAEQRDAAAAFDRLLAHPGEAVKSGPVTLRLINGGATIVRTDPEVSVKLRDMPHVRRSHTADWTDNKVVKEVGNPSDPDERWAKASGVTLSTTFELTYPDGSRALGGFLPGQNTFPDHTVTGKDLVARTVWVPISKFEDDSADYGVRVTESPNTATTEFDLEGDSLVTSNGEPVGQIEPISVSNPA